MCEPKISYGAIATSSAVRDVLTSKAALAVGAVSVSAVAVYSLGMLAFLGVPLMAMAAIVLLARAVGGGGVKTYVTAEAHRTAPEPARAAVGARPGRRAVTAPSAPPMAALEAAQPDVVRDPAKILRLDPADVLVEVGRK